ncbi:glycosyltransferase family 4 protein [Mucilaginibacter sp. BJC16-A38]|uniref:glycosyltransferase family 4 protein n=1 Tax=Mucilaginibacter phenanthrenivorans TaxID=1234842 RepID=UPI00215731A2|nr:glycosyltransferase family 4 protein [Mucilaginibacter phenanthrenivorans]MCR8559991.1 glycosyltransferase family 4 protein [Mucilaginibacter phenanthrenivorans]
MNILYLCDEYPPGKHGGIGTSVRMLARQMVKLGHHVIVAGLYAPGYGGADEFEDDGVKVYRFRRGFSSKIFSDEESLKSRIATRLLQVSGLMDREIRKSLATYKIELERLIKDHQIDIIEMPDYNDYIRFCSREIPFPVLSVPVAVKFHGSITYFIKEANGPLSGHILKMEQAIVSQAAAVVSVSEYTAKKSAAYLNYPGKIEVLYNGINTDTSVLKTSKKTYQVIFTGSLVEKKGIYQLAKAWNIVNKHVPNARLLICGKGDQQKVASFFTREAKDSVIFMGHLPMEKLFDQLSASNISVFPSYAEAFALAPMEAMLCGAAVINSNRTSGPELIDDNVNGVLIDPDRPEQIAEAILYLLNNRNICDNLAKKGNETVKEKFEITKVAEKYIEFYESVLKGRVI